MTGGSSTPPITYKTPRGPPVHIHQLVWRSTSRRGKGYCPRLAHTISSRMSSRLPTAKFTVEAKAGLPVMVLSCPLTPDCKLVAMPMAKAKRP